MRFFSQAEFSQLAVSRESYISAQARQSQGFRHVSW